MRSEELRKTPQKYVKKPVVIEAIQFTRDNWPEVCEFTKGIASNMTIEKCPDGKCWCTVSTLEGDHKAMEGDFIIKGVKGEFYPCKPDIFEKTYEDWIPHMDKDD